MRGKQRTHEQFIEELAKVNPNVKCLTRYINNRTKVLLECLDCGHKWWITPANALKGRGCPECAKINRVAHRITPWNIVQEQIETKSKGKYKAIGGYINKQEKCEILCTMCNKTFWMRPNDIDHGRGCPDCSKKRRALKRMIPLEVVIEMIWFISNGTILYVWGYRGIAKKCKWYCVTCGNVWETKPDNLLQGKGCPVCIKTSMERPVKEALDKKKINYDYDKRLEACVYDKYPLRPDFYIETNKGILWIECDGQQHFVDVYGKDVLKEVQLRDRFKDAYCKKHNICLIRVTSSTKWGTEKHITLEKVLELIEIGIDSNIKEINFDLFWQYDFNRE